MLHYIEHEKVIVRFVSLYLLGLVLFFAGSTLSYLVLPEGLIRGLSPLTQMAGDEAAAVVLSVLFLAGAAFREAYMVMQV